MGEKRGVGGRSCISHPNNLVFSEKNAEPEMCKKIPENFQITEVSTHFYFTCYHSLTKHSISSLPIVCNVTESLCLLLFSSRLNFLPTFSSFTPGPANYFYPYFLFLYLTHKKKITSSLKTMVREIFKERGSPCSKFGFIHRD